MNLVIDIGNSRIKLAVFENSEILHHIVVDELHPEHIQDLLLQHDDLKNVIVSSVRDYSAELKHFLRQSFDTYIELDADTPVPIINRYKTPESLGKDRLAAAVGATVLYPNQNVLVIDAGTAITYEFISSKHEYLGGNISPGLTTRFKALHQFTGKLPLLRENEKTPLIGTDTESAIQSGVQMGLLFEVEKYIEHFNTIYEKLQIIITGGDAILFDKKFKKTIFVAFNLTLIGLNRILEHNVKKT
ncbi:type III pantothenate kinase [Sunxiuqinia indica]|uniref:type III pantothenate kinase n=1 Tax=Sunxiuqinia indica TaxID=2692584 RepID=UPI00135CCD4C|nr:type III pantothenate kinase [Sunxiuqinia indica]